MLALIEDHFEQTTHMGSMLIVNYKVLAHQSPENGWLFFEHTSQLPWHEFDPHVQVRLGIVSDCRVNSCRIPFVPFPKSYKPSCSSFHQTGPIAMRRLCFRHRNSIADVPGSSAFPCTTDCETISTVKAHYEVSLTVCQYILLAQAKMVVRPSCSRCRRSCLASAPE